MRGSESSISSFCQLRKESLGGQGKAKEEGCNQYAAYDRSAKTLKGRGTPGEIGHEPTLELWPGTQITAPGAYLEDLAT